MGSMVVYRNGKEQNKLHDQKVVGSNPASVSVLLLWAGANPDDPFSVQKLA